jgi:hypothetical protein
LFESVPSRADSADHFLLRIDRAVFQNLSEPKFDESELTFSLGVLRASPRNGAIRERYSKMHIVIEAVESKIQVGDPSGFTTRSKTSARFTDGKAVRDASACE